MVIKQLPEFESGWFEVVLSEEFEEKENEEEKKESKYKIGVDDYILTSTDISELHEGSITNHSILILFKVNHFLSVTTPPPES